MFEELERMYRLAVWDNEGRQWLPVMGYGGQVEVYMRAQAALDIWRSVYL